MLSADVDFKQFRVAATSDNRNGFGLNGVILVAEDGEAWEVGKCQISPPNAAWAAGQTVHVPMVGHGPQWHLIGVEIPRQLDAAPPHVLRALWGREAPVGTG